ncbi:MAG: hypothetical protein KDA50_03465 [Rhodobacteraceae bacterium]|nr:hypothetical protein [Paracoccaceae bacterium]
MSIRQEPRADKRRVSKPQKRAFVGQIVLGGLAVMEAEILQIGSGLGIIDCVLRPEGRAEDIVGGDEFASPNAQNFFFFGTDTAANIDM